MKGERTIPLLIIVWLLTSIFAALAFYYIATHLVSIYAEPSSPLKINSTTINSTMTNSTSAIYRGQSQFVKVKPINPSEAEIKQAPNEIPSQGKFSIHKKTN